MQRRKGLIYPLIVDEITNYAELQEVWDCGYLTAYRIMYGIKPPTHRQKQQLADYLGYPIEVVFAKADPESDNTVSPDKIPE